MSHTISQLVTHPAGERITVAVIGAGGTGSLLLGTLARLNQAIIRLRSIYLQVRVFDPDRITDNNISRQNFSPSDRGRFKSKVITERLNRFYNTQWMGFPYAWEEEPELVRANIIITCTDTASSRTKLSRKLKKWSQTTDHPRRFAYWLDLGNTATTSNVILGGYGEASGDITSEEWIEGNWDKRLKKEAVLPFITERYNLRHYEKKNPLPSCSLAESLNQQHIMINDITSKVGAMLLWDLFTQEKLTWCGAFCNIESLNIKKIKC
jgi:PRTRC genetic system ThiF family protein